MRPPRPTATLPVKGYLSQTVFHTRYWLKFACNELLYSHHHPSTRQRKPTQSNTSTAEHTRYIVTFVFMLHQMTAGTGAGMLPTKFIDTAAQTECPVCLQNVAYGLDIQLLFWVSSGSVLKFSCTTDKSYMNTQTALHQTILFYERYFRGSWPTTPYLSCFFLVHTGMYKGHGWLQTMQPPFSYTSVTSGEISLTQQHNAEGCHTQNGLLQLVNTFKITKMQFVQPHVPAAKQHASAALRHDEFPDTRKQTLKVKQIYCPLEHNHPTHTMQLLSWKIICLPLPCPSVTC